ncbi:hypothetical protein BCR32DRAFT_271404 [Anaeromyces robustus]|jgi:DNA-directed RNA polymerase subunit M/transcription elongation factor TFIIS|uniref:C2H2-type domain-containing protein n=1 Tax=Anaeromyces robustus TaxID=1754192 RepID=A0A1Y1WRP1_9FUNG|nr:hypothetical protein BCR32DRAFT_271404 [Anaeromyces robustus]|eukprot:ORX76213.1 hypothetical protein BCR32DRAFT_271404 [Anaeromyces robustus]
MSSLSPQIDSFFQPFNNSSDNLKFILDLEQTLPDNIKFILDSNQTIPNIMNSSNDYLVSDQGANYISNNALYCPSAEKKGEPLKQYFSALATDGTNVLPIPDKKIIYGIYNVAYREKSCLSTPETKEIKTEVSGSGITTPQLTPFLNPRLSGEYCSQSQTLNVKAFPPSPVSPKINSLGNSSPYSFLDSNATLTPGSRIEASTPLSTLTYNGSIVSNNSTIDDDSIYNQTFFSNINNQQPLNSDMQQNLYYVNVNGNWELQNQRNTCFYAKRKEELKNIHSPIPLKKCKVYIPASEIQENSYYGNTNANVELTYQYPTNYQTQPINGQTNSSVQQIIVQQPGQNTVEQILVSNSNVPGIVVQQPQPQPTQQIIVQQQVPTITVTSMPLSTPMVNNVSLPVQVQQIQATEGNHQPVLVQLQPVNTVNSTIVQQPQSIVSTVSTGSNSLLFSTPQRLPSPIKQELSSPVVKLEPNSNNNNNEAKIITPVSSPMMGNESEEKPQSIVINLMDYKPISSHLENYKNNKPAVLKYMPSTKHKILKKKVEGSSRITKNSSQNKCDICQKEFLKYYQLKSHLKSHTSEKPYKCEYCTRAFCRKHDLRRHVRIHTGDTPYICSNCFKGFARSDACTRHVRQNLCKSNIINYNPETNKVEVLI